MKYRSRVDIVATMLQAAVGGATKTKMMYSAFLSHSQVEEYLAFLLSKRLVSVDDEETRKHYTPTEKGLLFLKMYDKIKDTVTVSGEQEEGTGPEDDLPLGGEANGAIQGAAGNEAARLGAGRTEARQ